ncbi:MAG: single-stranded DNA-binding protein [Pseudomonadota bacterium]|nr:single-stranded DNA-binding protein [Pseudomonadota bacterium]
MSYCRIIIAGNVGRDPETRFTAGGKQVTNFSVAVSEKRGQDESTTWFRCTAFEKTAKVVEDYVKKGSSVLVDGRIASRKFTDKEGMERESWEVTVDRLQLMGSKPEGSQHTASRAAMNAQASDGFSGMDDDIPFFDTLGRVMWSVV